MGEVSFEIESTDVKWLEKKEKDYLQKLLIEAPKHRHKPQEEIVKPEETIPPPEMTLNEFYRKYVQKIRPRPSIAVFFVYYLQRMCKKDKIITADVMKCFKDISYPNWNKLNVTDILNMAKRRALVNYVNKLWSLTTTGEDFVLNIVAGKTK